jgi:release factor glutamine methyltransferase
MLNVLQTALNISDQLELHYEDIHISQQVAWWLFQAATNKSKSELIATEYIELTDPEIMYIEEAVNEITLFGKPIQYILGSLPFGPITILCKPPVLVPRPETEEWVYYLIGQLNRLPHQELTILDIGTGSGCIALALAKAFPQCTVYGSDIFRSALFLAQESAELNDITNVRFLQSNLFHKIPKDLKFDLIVSNPPYLTEYEWGFIDYDIRDWEDRRALVTKMDGLSFLNRIAKRSHSFLKANPMLKKYGINQVYIEMGHTHGSRALKIFEKARYTNIQFFKDLYKKKRVISGRLDISHFKNK